jgi:hypothetical protein
MSDRDDRGVPRGDHVPAGEREANEQGSEHHAPAGEDSASERSHGAHGRGVGGREEHRDPVDVEPGEAEGGPRGSAGWGSEPSGGSVIDKR